MSKDVGMHSSANNRDCILPTSYISMGLLMCMPSSFHVYTLVCLILGTAIFNIFVLLLCVIYTCCAVVRNESINGKLHHMMISHTRAAGFD